jgi:multimeric flavodoxin WrbA
MFEACCETMIPRLLIVHHSRTGLARQMSEAMELGAISASQEMELKLDVIRKKACDANTCDVLHADGYLFCCPENLACASGAMLEFFHRTYYQAFDDCGESSLIAGRPYGLAIAAGSDGASAARQIEMICHGWRLRPVSGTLINVSGKPQTKDEILKPKVCSPEKMDLCKELGGLVAATLLL